MKQQLPSLHTSSNKYNSKQFALLTKENPILHPNPNDKGHRHKQIWAEDSPYHSEDIGTSQIKFKNLVNKIPYFSNKTFSLGDTLFLSPKPMSMPLSRFITFCNALIRRVVIHVPFKQPNIETKHFDISSFVQFHKREHNFEKSQ